MKKAKNYNLKRASITSILGVAVVLTAQWASAEPVRWTENGHYYDVIVSSAISWEEANAVAQGLCYNGWHGHLVTITSAGEDAFVNNLAWESGLIGSWMGLWAGGYQDPQIPASLTDPRAGWTWVHCEGPFGDYQPWSGSEPNDWPGPSWPGGYTDRLEQYLAVGNFSPSDYGWNDQGYYEDFISGYAVEYEPAAISDLSATPDVLRPPNHKMVLVTLNYTAPGDSALSCSLSARSDEPDNGLGDGDSSDDIQLIPNDAHHLWLRAERSGKSQGRTYTITVTYTDACGNTTSMDVLVTVPHSSKK